MDKYAYLKIDTDSNVELIVSDKREFNLDEFYKGIDCDTISIVPVQTLPNVLMVLDDNGKIFHRDINPLATILYGQLPHDFIVGDVILGIRDDYPEADVYKMPYNEAVAIYMKIVDLVNGR